MASMNLLDLAKLNGSDAVVGLIEDSIEAAPELKVIPARTIKGTTYQTVVRTGLPSVGFRSANQGVAAGKSKFASKIVQAFILSGRIEIDQAILLAGDRSPEELKAIEGSGVMEAILRAVGTQVFYGTAADGKGFPGLASMVDDDMVVDATGSSSATGSSVYAVRFGPKAVEFVTGNNTVMDLGAWRIESMIDADGKKFPAEVADLTGWIGLQCVSKYAVGRIRDLTADTGKGLTDLLVATLLAKWRGPGPDALFMNRRSAFQLQTSRTLVANVTTSGKADGGLTSFAPQPTESNGIPIVITDQLTNTETLV